MEKINLLTRNGEKASCELSVPLEALQAYLEDRIELGIKNFFIALKNAFAGKEFAEFHILLAGNWGLCFALLPEKGTEKNRLNPELFGLADIPLSVLDYVGLAASAADGPSRWSPTRTPGGGACR